MSDTSMSIRAVVVAFGSSPGIRALIETLLSVPSVIGVTIVDNGADIDDRLRAGGLAGCDVIKSPINAGYATAVQLAVAGHPDDWDGLLVVNPDVIPDSGALHRLIERHATERPALTSGLLVENGIIGANVRGQTGWFREFVKATVGATAAWRFRRGSGYPSGALMLIDRAAWSQLGGLDPRFELYYEDVELVDRYLRAGERIVIVDDIVGEHRGGVSSGSGSGRAFGALRVSRLRYLRGRYGAFGSWWGALLTASELPGHVVFRRTVPLVAWWTTMRSVVREAIHPGSVSVLDERPIPWSAESGVTVSIAMCTFNGAAFLREQLDSIATQTRPPDGMVVCDDGSSDDTIEIVRAWAEQVPFHVEIVVNDRQLGVGPNFEQAIRHCSGDLIALCDQDDRWRPDRLERQTATLAAWPAAGYCFSDAGLIDAVGDPVHGHLWQRVRFKSDRRFVPGQEMARLALRRGVVTGATTMLRRRSVEPALPVPAVWIHDHWISLVLGATGVGGVADPDPVIDYRIHVGQAAGVRSGPLDPLASLAGDDGFDHAVHRLEVLAERLQDGSPTSDATLAKLAHLQRRREARRLARKQRLAKVAREVADGHYHRHSNGWRSALSDMRHARANAPDQSVDNSPGS